jgi:hypothetical protein
LPGRLFWMHRPRQGPVGHGWIAAFRDMAETALLRRLYNEGRHLLHAEDEDA